MFFSVDSRLRENDDGDAGGRSENAGDAGEGVRRQAGKQAYP